MTIWSHKTRAICGMAFTLFIAIVGVIQYSRSATFVMFGVECPTWVIFVLVLVNMVLDGLHFTAAAKRDEMVWERIFRDARSPDGENGQAALTAPCTIVIRRGKGLRGVIYKMRVYINRAGAGVVKNKQTAEFTSGVLYNDVTVVHGRENKSQTIHVTAPSGGRVLLTASIGAQGQVVLEAEERETL